MSFSLVAASSGTNLYSAIKKPTEMMMLSAIAQPLISSFLGKPKKEEMSGWAMALNIIISVGFFIALYKFVPLLAATKLKDIYPAFGNQVLFNIVDGVIRIAIFLLFIWGT